MNTTTQPGPLEVRLSDELGGCYEHPDSKWWWKEMHSGSEAIETARRFLKDAREFGQGDLNAFAMAQVCSELLFRVTGEMITPREGFYWADREKTKLEGPLFSGYYWPESHSGA